MKKAIEIETLRINSAGTAIEFIINCPADYLFTEFNIQVGDEDDEYSVADSLFKDEGGDYITDTDNRFLGEIPVSLFGVSSPKIYRIHLEAKHLAHTSTEEKLIDFNGTTSDTTDDILVDKDFNRIEEYIYADAYISDVSHAYECLMDDIVAFSEKCTNTEALDRVIRNYLILYAHQEALRLGYIDEATKWFGMILNCFSGKCGGDGRKGKSVGCGCNSERREPSHSGCGCHR